jgi:Uri superfamily endonuclease
MDRGAAKGKITLGLPVYDSGFYFFWGISMKRVLRRVARKIKRHHHKKHMAFLEALRLYSGMPVSV